MSLGKPSKLNMMKLMKGCKDLPKSPKFIKNHCLEMIKKVIDRIYISALRIIKYDTLYVVQYWTLTNQYPYLTSDDNELKVFYSHLV